jgi:deferrochelatase/peroxidase EfeB
VSAQTPSQLEKPIAYPHRPHRIPYPRRRIARRRRQAAARPAAGLLGKTFRPDGLTITVSVGASLFDARFGLADKKPKHLIEMARFPNDKLAAEWCDGDFSLQICALSPETCQKRPARLGEKTPPNTPLSAGASTAFCPKPNPAPPRATCSAFATAAGNPDVSNPKTADEVLWTGIAANSLDEPAWAKKRQLSSRAPDSSFLSNFGTVLPCKSKKTIFGREKYSGRPTGHEKRNTTAPTTPPTRKAKTIPHDSHMRLANPRSPEFMQKHQFVQTAFRLFARPGQIRPIGTWGLCLSAIKPIWADGFIFVQNLLNGEPLEEIHQPLRRRLFLHPARRAGGRIFRAKPNGVCIAIAWAAFSKRPSETFSYPSKKITLLRCLALPYCLYCRRLPPCKLIFLNGYHRYLIRQIAAIKRRLALFSPIYHDFSFCPLAA